MDNGALLLPELCKLLLEAPPNPVDEPNVGGATVVSTDLEAKLDPNGLLLIAPVLAPNGKDEEGALFIAVNGLAAELKEEKGIAVDPDTAVGFAKEPEGNNVLLLPNPNGLAASCCCVPMGAVPRKNASLLKELLGKARF